MENIFIGLAEALWQLVRPVLSALSPLLIGLILAYLLNPVVDWLRPKVGCGWAIFFTYTALFAALGSLIYGFVILILGALPTGNLQETANLVAAYFERAYVTAVDFVSNYLPPNLAEEGAGEAAKGLESWLEDRLSLKSLTTLVSAVSGSLVSLFLGLVASIYLLKDKEFFQLLWERFLSLVLKQRAHGLVSETMSEVNGVLTAFLKGALVDSLIVAFLSSAVLTILQVDFAVVIGVIGGILNIIPYFGPFIGMVPAFLVAFFDGGLPQAVAALIALFIVQQIDSDLIYPHIVGNTTGLHPLFVLLSVSILGYFFGLAGMLLAVPAAGILQVFIRRWAYR